MIPKRVLLDENLSPKLRQYLPGHIVITTQYQGWEGKKNGELIALAEDDGFDVFVTRDRNLGYQQNLTGRKMALVVVIVNKGLRRKGADRKSHNKQGQIILNNAQRILAAIDAATINDYIQVILEPSTL